MKYHTAVPGLTNESTVRLGEPGDSGTDRTYARLTAGRGENRARRMELAPQRVAGRPIRRSILQFAHLTDLHVADVASPGRLEFLERYYDGAQELRRLLPAHRPQEAFAVFALEMMLRTVNGIVESTETGSPVQFLLSTGDSTDNNQFNELHRFLQVMRGGCLFPASGSGRYEGVQSVAWSDPAYWHPDPYDDQYKRRWGFPTWPGILTQAALPFEAQGCRLPWFSCYGNHDALAVGMVAPTPDYETILAGSRKPVRLPATTAERLRDMVQDPAALLVEPMRDPGVFLGGSSRPITPDPRRRTFTRREYVDEHIWGPGQRSHGFDRLNLQNDTAYYVSDEWEQVRLIVLDTVNPAGHYNGSIGSAQFQWLEDRLEEVHSCYYDELGRPVRTGYQDRLAIVCSHHGLVPMTNSFALPPDLAPTALDTPRVLGHEIAGLLCRFPNVVLWVNGHTHHNKIVPRPDPSGRTAGFWEVTTSSLVDWPCQGRLVELTDNGDGSLSILCTSIDHAAPADPRCASGLAQLASLHRELAANDPHAGWISRRRGTLRDRTVELVLPQPFCLG